MPILVVGLFLLAGVVLIVEGVIFRRGGVRGVARYYFLPSFPFYARNWALGAVPLGISALLFGLGGALSRNESLEDAAAAAFGFAVLAAFAAVLLMLYAPSWTKPQWIRERERE
jgi:hypothetical protein